MSGHSSDEIAGETVASSTTVSAVASAKRRGGVHTTEKKTGVCVCVCVCVRARVHACVICGP